MLGRLRADDEEDLRDTEFLDGDPTAVVFAKVFLTQGGSRSSPPFFLARTDTLSTQPRDQSISLA